MENRLRVLKIKLDENLSRHLKTTLRNIGIDAVMVTDEGLLSQLDPVIASAAREEGRMLFTLDLEFADLRKYPAGNHPGIVLFRPGSLGPLSVNRVVEKFARETDLVNLTGCVVVVESSRIRIRRPKLPPS